MKPARYYVEWVTEWREDNPPKTACYDATTLAAARLMYSVHLDALPQIIERNNIRDVTPAGDPPGLLWDFEEEVVVDAP